MNNKGLDQSISEEKKPKYTVEDFKKALRDLVEKMKYEINVEPVFFEQDNGTFSIQIRTTIRKIE